MTLSEQLIYAVLWLLFGAAHSVLASETAKRLTRALFGRLERQAYNLIAVFHFVATVAAGRYLLGGAEAEPFVLPPLIQAGMGAALVAGARLILLALRHYDLRRFAGTALVPEGAVRSRCIRTGCTAMSGTRSTAVLSCCPRSAVPRIPSGWPPACGPACMR